MYKEILHFADLYIELLPLLMMLVQFMSKDDERCYSYFWWYVCVSKSIFTWTEFGKVHLAHRCVSKVKCSFSQFVFTLYLPVQLQ